MDRWNKLSEELIHKNPWYSYKHDTFLIHNTGYIGNYYYIDSRGCSIIIALDKNKNILMTRQYRYLFDNQSVELPCGGRKEHQTFYETAMAELEEETGYKAAELKRIGVFSVCNGLSNEKAHLYLADKLSKTNQKLDETEDIKVFALTLAAINQKIVSGIITDSLTITAIKIFEEYQKTKKILKKNIFFVKLK